MLLIRIEHKNGNGVFRAVDCFGVAFIRELNEYTSIADRHRHFPTPQQEGLFNVERHVEYCGFKSIEQLKKWFTYTELEALIDIGFKIYQIHVSDDSCRVGSNQILYKKSAIIYKKDISDFLLKKLV